MIVPPPTLATAISFARATVVLTCDEAVAVCVDAAGFDEAVLVPLFAWAVATCVDDAAGFDVVELLLFELDDAV